MDQTVRIGRIAGIPIGLHWSVLGVVALLAWELAGLVLPHDQPDQPTAAYWIVGLAATLLFFVSLLAHEASHALVALRNGIAVRRITLWLFGGVSELEKEALTPGADFRIAVVGPLVSLVLAGVFGVLATLVRAGSGTTLVAGAGLAWLAWINLLLGGFNLIPAAPLDGGRVLRAALWRRNGDRAAAAATASRWGEGFGFVLVALGVLESLTVGVVGLWFVFLGWFLLSAARAERSAAVLRSALAGVPVRDLMTPDPATFAATTTVAELFDRHLHHLRFGTFPLVGPDGRLSGLTTLNRIRRVRPERRTVTRLGDTAGPLADVPFGTPDEPAAELLERMQAAPDGRALVLDGSGHLVGVVSPTDVSRFVQLSMVRSPPGRSR